MIDNLIKMAKEQLGGELMSKFGLTSNQVDDSMEVAKDSLVEGVRNEANHGNVDSLLSMFNSGTKTEASNPIVSFISNKFVSGITEKLGVSSDKAQMISNVVIPFIMDKFASKDTGEAKDGDSFLSMFGIDLGNTISSIFSGNKVGSGLLGNIGKLF